MQFRLRFSLARLFVQSAECRTPVKIETYYRLDVFSDACQSFEGEQQAQAPIAPWRSRLSWTTRTPVPAVLSHDRGQGRPHPASS